jgi:TatD DNase family protein
MLGIECQLEPATLCNMLLGNVPSTSSNSSPVASMQSTLPPLIDIGVNLSHESFNNDREHVIAAAIAAGLEAMVLTGTSVASSELAAALAGMMPGFLYSTAGLHPHDAAGFGVDTCAQLHAISQQPHVVAIGETGLDFNRDFSPRHLQEAAFAAQLELAVQTGLPVFLHQRDAHEHFHAILKEQRDHLTRGVVHCFTGSKDELFDYLDLDMYIGITGWVCDERRGLHVQELLHDIPANRLLLETDAPYLLPRNIRPKPRGRRNEPANLIWVLGLVAERLGVDRGSLARQTTANAKLFFGI